VRIVVHKTTTFTDAEREGIAGALSTVPAVQLLTPEIAQALDRDEEHVLEGQRARVGRSALSLQAPRGADLGPALEDECGREDDGCHSAEFRALLERLMTLLPARDREGMRLRFGADMTQAEIGAALGISQMQVSRILRKAIDRLSEIVHQQEQLQRARRCA
jgi:RNA polymerase sigma-B factor